MIKKLVIKKPWGSFEKYTHNKISTVKILTVLPGKKLSLQYHHNRDEFWKVLQGNPIVIVGDKETEADINDEFFIYKQVKHRIISQDQTVQLLEISFGEFDEADIVRLEDDHTDFNANFLAEN